MSKLLSSTEVAAKIGYSIESFRKKIKFVDGFPKPVRITDKSHPKWREEDIEMFIKKVA